MTERFGKWPANILQAAAFAIAHVGIDPFHGWLHFWSLLVLRFGCGMVFGWLKMKRGTLLAPAVAHGIIG